MALNGSVRSGPLLLLRLEGAALLAIAILAYVHTTQPWWLFILLFLAPDLSMFLYLVNARFGAAGYNAAHTTVVPLILFGVGISLGSSVLTALSLIWLAHIGFDRMLGFGLKYASGFADTHLGQLGVQRVH